MEYKREFLNCGGYSEKFSKMLNDILKAREENGEKITPKDVDEVCNSINEAYSVITGKTTDDNVISQAIDDLITRIDRNGDLNNIVKDAEECLNGAIIERYYVEDEENQKIGVIPVTIGTAGIVIGGTATNIVRSLYSANLQQQINTMYSSAASGNLKSIANLNEIEKLTAFLDKNEILTEKSERYVLARMMRLASLEDDTVNQALLSCAQKANIDIFKEDEIGNKMIDTDKLQKKYHNAIEKVNPKVANFTLDDFNKLAMKSAQKEKAKGTYSKSNQTIENAIDAKSKQYKLTEYEQKINSLYNKKDYVQIKKELEKNGELSEKMLKDVVKWQRSANPLKDNSSKLYMLGDMMSEILGISIESIRAEYSEIGKFISETNIKMFPNGNEQEIDDERA